MAQIIFTISIAQYQGKLVKGFNMDILWRIYLMEKNNKFNYFKTNSLIEDEEFQ